MRILLLSIGMNSFYSFRRQHCKTAEFHIAAGSSNLLLRSYSSCHLIVRFSPGLARTKAPRDSTLRTGMAAALLSFSNLECTGIKVKTLMRILRCDFYERLKSQIRTFSFNISNLSSSTLKFTIVSRIFSSSAPNW